MENNEQKVTKEEALQRIDDNLETIKFGKGQIRVNKTFFKVCAGVGLVATGFGIAGMVVVGLLATPIVTTVLGGAATATGLVFNKLEDKEKTRLEEAEERNNAAKSKILLRDENTQFYRQLASDVLAEAESRKVR